MIRGRKILLGITGSIAAYKSALLVRLLVKEGAEVKVIMTDAAKDFIAPLTLSVLSKNPVLNLFADKETGEWSSHVDLGIWADALVIAPASANTISKMATGLCDNLLLAVYLSARCPVFIAPAMDLDMWKHPGTVSNVEKLKSVGNILIEPADGELASGLSGTGRMEEPENILDFLAKYFSENLSLANKRALVTAGPTYENIDPVRFIGNRSSGKMGFAIANELAHQGAEVTLISGPSAQTESGLVKRINVETAKEMYEACLRAAPDMDILVMAAAVADYRPETESPEKMKKQNNSISIPLTPTEDILAELGKRKKSGQLLVGFALETSNEIENAKGKLQRKNLDLVVLNSLNDEGAGFNTDTNLVSIIDREMNVKEFPLKTKQEVARDLVKVIVEHLKSTGS